MSLRAVCLPCYGARCYCTLAHGCLSVHRSCEQRRITQVWPCHRQCGLVGISRSGLTMPHRLAADDHVLHSMARPCASLPLHCFLRYFYSLTEDFLRPLRRCFEVLWSSVKMYVLSQIVPARPPVFKAATPSSTSCTVAMHHRHRQGPVVGVGCGGNLNDRKGSWSGGSPQW